MPSALNKKDPPRDRRRKSRNEDDAERAAAVHVVRERMPRWARAILAFVALVFLFLGVAFAGAWMGVRSIETQINYGPELEPEDGASAGLPALTLGRGLDLAMERPNARAGSFSARMPSSVRWAPGGMATALAKEQVVTPDGVREVELPFVPKRPGDERLESDPRVVSSGTEREGGLDRSERLATLSASPGRPGPAEADGRAPGTPAARPPDPSPQTTDPASTLPPPYVYNEAVGVIGRSHPIPFTAEYALPAIIPPDDDAPLEAGEVPASRIGR